MPVADYVETGGTVSGCVTRRHRGSDESTWLIIEARLESNGSASMLFRESTCASWALPIADFQWSPWPEPPDAESTGGAFTRSLAGGDLVVIGHAALPRPAVAPNVAEWLRRSSGASVPTVLDEIKRTSELTDAEVAALLPGGVARETVTRWHRGTRGRIEADNLNRLVMLRGLFRALSAKPAHPRTWLLSPFDGVLSPYVLLADGRLTDVLQMVADIPDDPHEAATHVTRLPPPIAERRTVDPAVEAALDNYGEVVVFSQGVQDEDEDDDWPD